MAISRYPHLGYRIAPATLREILEVQVPTGIIPGSPQWAPKFSDLDETSWQRFTVGTCEKLGKAVVLEVASHHSALPPQIMKRRIPQPRAGTTIEDLELEARTRNCVKRMIGTGRIKILQNLGDLTVGEILPVHGFGAKCLVDLLSAVEAVALQSNKPETRAEPDAAPIPQSGIHGRLHQRLTAEAKRIKRSRWARRVRYDDPRLGAHLKNIYHLSRPGDDAPGPERHSTAFDFARHIVDRDSDPTDSALLAARLRRLRKEAVSMTAMTLEEEFCGLIAAFGRRKSIAMVARREGWDGRGACTLHIVGQENGLTRERVRQICERVEDSIRERIPFTPILDRALALVRARVPGIADEIELELRSKGISKHPFRIEGLLRAVEIKGEKAPFMLFSSGPRRIVLPIGRSPYTTSIIIIARRTVTRRGVANIQDVAAQLAERENKTVDTALVAQILSAEPSFQWLDEEKGWFRLCDLPRNVLLSIMTKVFSVTREIGIGELRSAVARHHRLQGFTPPRSVLLELCRRASGLRVEGSKIKVIDQPNLEATLVGAERTLAQILVKYGPIMRRERIEELCITSGMKRSTCCIYLDRSPVVARYATGVYGLVGADVEPGFVESLMAKRRPEKVVLDFGWRGSQSIWIGYRLSRNMIKTGMCNVPGAMQRFLTGDYLLKDEDGLVIGQIRSTKTHLSGLSPLFLRRGGEPGDYLALILDLQAKEAFPYLGDQGLLRSSKQQQTKNTLLDDPRGQTAKFPLGG
jgi:hypothetical protein